VNYVFGGIRGICGICEEEDKKRLQLIPAPAKKQDVNSVEMRSGLGL